MMVLVRRFILLVPLLCAAARAASLSEVPGREFLLYTGVNPAAFENRATRTTAMQSLSRAVFARYRDEVDFVLVFGNRRALPESSPVRGFHLAVMNDVRGIGTPLFNAGRNYGGTAKLRAMIYFPNWFPFWRVPLVHELAHTWGNDLLPTSEPGHFGFCGAGSQLGGFDSGTLRRLTGNIFQARNRNGLPFGTAANGGNSVPYSEFELYLMGLTPAQAVKPFQCAYAGTWLDAKTGTFTANRMHTLNIQDLQKKYGARQPDFTRAPKTFRVLAVLVSEKNPSSLDLAGVNVTLRQLVTVGDNGDSTFTFNEATRGAGRLELALPRTLRR